MRTERYGATIDRIKAFLEAKPYDSGAYEDLLSMYKAELDGSEEELSKALAEGDTELIEAEKKLQKWLHGENKALRERKLVPAMQEMVSQRIFTGIDRMNGQYRRSLLMDARADFDAYMLYIEQDREPSRRFWMPRRATLIEDANAMSELVDGDLSLLGLSLPPGTGKTTLAIFLLTWVAGRWPDEYSVTFSHDGDILKGMYGEVLRIINPAGEYLWKDVFPEVPLVSTNAKDLRIDLGHGSRFETLQFASIGSDNAGKVRASKLLYCDDLVGSIEQAMSKERLDKLWTQYTTDIKQRGTGDWRELHIATRWSLWDPIGRLERMEQDKPTGKRRFISVPALNENDESNFDYPGLVEGSFSTERYQELRDSMDPVNWEALYMNHPIEREGQLYNADELRRFFEMPKGEPDAILSVCDTKNKGSDYCCMPVAYQYGNDYYIPDVVFDNGDTGVVEEKLARMLADRKVQVSQFESNNAGWSIAEKVEKRMKELGGRCAVTTKPTTANKETKIVVNAPFVKSNCLFLDPSKYRRNSEYGRFMEALTTYSVMGNNKHDDAPDAMAQFALFAENLVVPSVQPIRRPW